LTRLHGLADQLASTDRSSSLSLILSTLGAALGTERLCLHLFEGDALCCIASMGFSPALLEEWSRLPLGIGGGPVGLAAETREPVVVDDVRTSETWSEFRAAARTARIGSSWTIPMTDANGLVGVFTVLRPAIGKPRRDELDLVTLYAGYAASALERDRLFGEATTRNRVLETIREVLEILAGPVPVGEGLVLAARALREGLQADEVALVALPDGDPSQVRAAVGEDGASVEPSPATLQAAAQVLGSTAPSGVVVPLDVDEERHLTVTFAAPGGRAALLARWTDGSVPDEATALMADAANSLRLALEREEVGLAHQEAAALRRSHELQRGFLSRLSHELRTPLTAIRGYASSLMQSDVTWDPDSQRRFLTRIAAESARLGRLVGDLLDFSAIESGVLRLQRDWCDLPLVIDAATACLPPQSAAAVEVACSDDLPVVLADHDRLEQVLVNLMDNALRHNPAGTKVYVDARLDGDAHVAVTVSDDGDGIPGGLTESPFEPGRRRWTPTAGTGLGLSIAKGIIDAHGGTITLEASTTGTTFRLELPIEGTEGRVEEAPQSALSLGPAGTPLPSSAVLGVGHDALSADG
jgi:signal transduction histidine kinase